MSTMTSPSRLEEVWKLCQENKDFRQQWEGLYDKTMKYVRIHCVELLCDNVWKDVVKCQSDGQIEIVQKYAQGLLSDVVKHFDDKIERCENSLVSDKMAHVVTRDDLKKSYENDPYRFIETLVRCLKEEELLIHSFTKPSEEEVERENITQSMKFLNDAQQHEETLKSRVKSLCSLIDEEKKKNVELSKKEREVSEIQQMTESTRKKNGVSPLTLYEKLQGEIGTIKERLRQIDDQIEKVKLSIRDALRKFLGSGQELQKRFSEVIKKWKHNSKLKYVFLADSEYPLQGMDDRCKKYGKLLYSTLHFIQDDLLVMSSVKWDMDRDVELQSSINSLYQLFEEICQSTFIVTDQVRHLVKVELGSKKRTKDAADDDETKPGQNFKCPKFNAVVRLIATELIVGRLKVKAYFCHQQTLNDLHKKNKWEDLEKESFPMQEKNNARCIGFSQQGFAAFRNLELTNFKRDPDKHVCEEKYRLVFTTEQEVAGRKIKLRTLSLPIIITTGASQGSNAHGSLLWQCFSINDVMEFPLDSPSVLPWSTVSAMLNCKFKTLGGRDLRADELQHLACRVSGIPASNLTKDTEIQFRKFCLDKMMDVKESKDAKNKSATFWMWILSVFNLTKFHLREYWNETLIDGFSAKEESDRKLKCIHPFKPYTFLLRFSDTIITDVQGQNMCGAVSAAFVFKTEDEVIKVGNARPFKAESFKKKNLAQLIRSVHLKENEKEEVSLKWLYPGHHSRDEAFQSFYQPSSRMKDSDENYPFEFEERLVMRLKDFSMNDTTCTKKEPPSDVPVGKKIKQCNVEQQTPNSYSDPQAELLAKWENIDQFSPSSTIYGGDQRNNSESTPMSEVQSPASSYMMSPENSMSNGMTFSMTSPQSSIDENQVLSPEQEASIPVTVLDEIGQPSLNGNMRQYNFAVIGSHGYSPQDFQRSFSLPEQHPTLTNLLKTTNSREELRAKLLAKNLDGSRSAGQLPPFSSNIQQQSTGLIEGHGFLDLNSLQREYSSEMSQMDMLQLASVNNQYQGESNEQAVFEEVENPLQNFEMEGNFEINLNPELTQEQINTLSNMNSISHEQLQQMANMDPTRQFGALMSLISGLIPQNDNH